MYMYMYIEFYSGFWKTNFKIWRSLLKWKISNFIYLSSSHWFQLQFRCFKNFWELAVSFSDNISQKRRLRFRKNFGKIPWKSLSTYFRLVVDFFFVNCKIKLKHGNKNFCGNHKKFKNPFLLDFFPPLVLYLHSSIHKFVCFDNI